MSVALPFREVWCCDFEFNVKDGERPAVLCVVASEYHSGRKTRLWLDGDTVPPARAPFAVDADALFVAYFASAEMGCFRALGWPMPANVLDLYVEAKWLTCGRASEPSKPSLVYTLDRFGVSGIDAEEKESMRQLAIRGGPYNDEERQALLDYCESDVAALTRLLPRMLPLIDLPRAVLRGRFMKAIARVEYNGIPVDVPTLALLDRHWESLQTEMVRAVDASYGVYEGTSFRAERFARWLARHGIPWPRLHSTGELELNDETFADMAEAYPALQPLRQLRQALGMLRLTDLPVGRDGRNRCLMSPFGTITGRCAPSTSKFIFARPAWMRSLIRPEEGRALAYVDWSSQEYGIGAVLSGDPAMTADYEAGDPYLGFARRIGMVPAGATKKTHKAERDVVKAVVLGTQYGMGEQALAARIGRPVVYARDLLKAHRTTYRRFWEWSDGAVNHALFRGRLWTRFGWQTWAGPGRAAGRHGDPNVRSLANFPCQANAADMLRLAAGYVCDAGVMLDATVHDAVLIEAAAEEIDGAVGLTQEAMGRASELVLGGFRLRTECEEIVWPDRYRDARGAAFFDALVCKMESRQPSRRPWEEVLM